MAKNNDHKMSVMSLNELVIYVESAGLADVFLSGAKVIGLSNFLEVSLGFR